MHELTTTVEEPLKETNVPYSSTINMTVQSLISPTKFCILVNIHPGFFSYLLPLPSAEEFLIFNVYEQKQTIWGVF